MNRQETATHLGKYTGAPNGNAKDNEARGKILWLTLVVAWVAAAQSRRA
jgi:hypothetical protein